ncbi:MAG: flagellar biosynthetic protein FliO [Chloroflexota bacterium]|nr:flagellar biosynthetic protein FliO [Dehalococcoidia bacterium]MDW8254871.1 flagellar biosynthetic protein FliO [Chloroflexota bacterium]
MNGPGSPDLMTQLRRRWERLSPLQRALVGGGAILLACGYVLFWTAEGVADGPGVLTAVDLGAKLLIVLVLIGLSAQLLRAVHGRSMAPGRARQVDVLEVTHLASNRTLYLVQVGDQTLLLGVTPHQITTLSRLDGGRERRPFAAALERAAREEGE